MDWAKTSETTRSNFADSIIFQNLFDIYSSTLILILFLFENSFQCVNLLAWTSYVENKFLQLSPVITLWILKRWKCQKVFSDFDTWLVNIYVLLVWIERFPFVDCHKCINLSKLPFWTTLLLLTFLCIKLHLFYFKGTAFGKW